MKELEWGLPHSSFGLWENDTRLTGLELDSNHQSLLSALACQCFSLVQRTREPAWSHLESQLPKSWIRTQHGEWGKQRQ